MEHETRQKHARRPRKTRPDYWKIAALALIVALGISLYYNFSTPAMPVDKNIGIGLTAAEEKAVNVINNNLLPAGSTATVDSKSEKSGMYRLVMSVDGEIAELYVSPDGKLLFTGAIDLENPPTPQQTQPEAQPVGDIDMDALINDDPTKGSPDATVTIIEFSDFECPFCGRFYSQTYDQLMTEYIDTGKVRYVFKDFPLSFHQNAQKAAEAAECADDQGKFWEMHDMIFENQQNIGLSDLKGYAEDLGLDTETFNGCLDSGKHYNEVQTDMALGSAAGISGTPGFIINGKLLSGALPFSSFKEIIEEELAR